MPARYARSLAGRLTVALEHSRGIEAVAETVCRTVVGEVPFVFGCLAATDPLTGLITWTYKTHALPIGDEQFAAAEYGRPDINRFVDLARRTEPVGVLSLDTQGQPETCRRFADFLQPQFGFTDELRAVFRVQGLSWGVLALYRGVDEPAFTATEAALVASAHTMIADAIRGAVFSTDPTAPHPPTEPAVLIIDQSGQVRQITQTARALIDELGGWENDSLPTNLLAVAAGARSGEALARSYARSRSGHWLTLRATALGSPAGSHDVVVTIDHTPRVELRQVALLAAGLTEREQHVAELVLQGSSTKDAAAALHLSPLTVQDHLKSIFGKLGVNSRREMIAKLVLG